jgi:DNA-binding XRE family transcriptional regulator
MIIKVLRGDIMKNGLLFERALEEADITLVAGTELKVTVKKKGAHLRLVVNESLNTDFENSILSRANQLPSSMKEYIPKLLTGEKIKALRMANNLTLQKLADKAELSRGTLGSIEKGKRSVGLEVLKRIAMALKVSISALTD